MGRARELNLTPLFPELWLRGGLQSWSAALKRAGKKSQFYKAQCTSSQASALSTWIASRSPIHHLVPWDDAAQLQSEPFFNISQRKGRRKQKDHLLPLIEKQDRKTDKPRQIGTIPQTSIDPREQGDECGIKKRACYPCCPVTAIPGCHLPHLLWAQKTSLKGRSLLPKYQKELPQHFSPCHSLSDSFLARTKIIQC